MCRDLQDGGGCGLHPGDALSSEQGNKEPGGQPRGQRGGESSMAESAFCLAGQSKQSGFEGEDGGEAITRHGGRAGGRETCQEAGPGPSSGTRAESVFIAENGWGRKSWRLYPSAHSCLSGELWATGVGPWRVPTLGPEDIPCFLSTVQDQPKDRDPSPASLCPRSQ